MKTGVSYFGNRIVEHVREDMDTVREAGCTFVVHTFSENDLFYYRETMGEIVAVSQDAGLEVYLDPWGVGGVFGGEAFSRWIAGDRDICQQDSQGNILPCACLNHRTFRDLMAQWSEAALEAGPQVLFWDEPHLGTMAGQKRAWSCRCPVCQEFYREWYGEEMPVELTPVVAQFREDTLVDFLRFLLSLRGETSVQNAVCLLPFEDPDRGMSDWESVASLSDLDILASDPYPIAFRKETEPFVRHVAHRLMDLSQAWGLEPQLWVQAFGVPAGREDEIEMAIRIGEEVGIRNFAAWGFAGCGHMSSLASQQPDRVWEVLTRSYRSLLGRSEEIHG